MAAVFFFRDVHALLFLLGICLTVFAKSVLEALECRQVALNCRTLPKLLSLPCFLFRSFYSFLEKNIRNEFLT